MATPSHKRPITRAPRKSAAKAGSGARKLFRIDPGIGRPTKLTNDIIDEVARLLPKTYYIETVCVALGITGSTLRNWLNWGREEASRLKHPEQVPDKNKRLYLEFFVAYKRALARGEIEAVAQIREAGNTQWQALAWLLERRFPERWGSQRREISELQKQLAALHCTLDRLARSQPTT
jgi:hypothetical protein